MDKGAPQKSLHGLGKCLAIEEEGEGNCIPLQYSCLDNPVARGACGAAAHGVAQNWTSLKRLSSSSSIEEEE